MCSSDLTLASLLGVLAGSGRRWLVFCDDLSFDEAGARSARDGESYRALKAVLEGGIEGRPENVLFYATSNRRHMIPRDIIENESATAIRPMEAVDEKVSLSDRFGLWLGFHPASQDDYFEMLDAYVARYRIPVDRKSTRLNSSH